MFWGKKKDDEREKHVKQLKNAFPSLTRPNNDDNQFDIKFVIENQRNILRIILPNDFPSTRPGITTKIIVVFRQPSVTLISSAALQVLGSVNHPWLDQYKQVQGSSKVRQ
jgi:hypothetical protein